MEMLPHPKSLQSHWHPIVIFFKPWIWDPYNLPYCFEAKNGFFSQNIITDSLIFFNALTGFAYLEKIHLQLVEINLFLLCQIHNMILSITDSTIR